ncbi:MAG: HAMP domain-containing histidine kinase [Phycisphaerae bacterium]|nr:HAMP domain-containing histidine kinase [Phycisphaerae bacterium]
MKLRHKLGIASLIYVVSLSVNLAMSGWCILVYFQSAFVEFQSTSARQAEIEWVRALVRRQLKLLEKGTDPAGYRELQLALAAGLLRLEADAADDLDAGLLSSIRMAADSAQQAAGRRLGAAGHPGIPATALSEQDREPFGRLDRLLRTAGTTLSQDRETAMQRAGATQQRVVVILVANAACGMLLCVLGLVLVRRWVLRPVEDLRAATKEISRGHFEYRMKPRSRDELGKFAEEVNHMAETIVQMQTKLVEQERVAAAGAMVTRLVHNIRNPLAGIRGLAEETLQVSGDSEAIADAQQRIIDSIDRFEKWLRDLQRSVSPLTLNLRRIRVGTLVANVLTALRPMADRRNVRIEVDVPPSMPSVELDDAHFEQVLVALVTNALQASRDGQTVQVSVSPRQEPSGSWRLSVRDEGPGVSQELQEKIFLPYFTTKASGNGVGLAMANKVVKLHGGRLTVESQPGHGARFDVDMPGPIRR